MAFTFNGISSKTMKLYAYLASWQIIPEQENQFLKVIGKEGVLDLGRSSTGREIRFQASLRPQQNMRAVMQCMDDLAAWLSPEQGLKRLVLDEFPDRYFLARVSALLDYQRLLRTTGSFELLFTCPDPYGYALADDEFIISSEGTYDFQRTQGNALSYPTITVSGEFTESRKPVLRLEYGGETLEISGVFPEGSKLEVDTGLQTARFINPEGQTIGNGMPALTAPVFPKLVPGQNQIKVSGERLILDEIHFKANSRWR